LDSRVIAGRDGKRFAIHCGDRDRIHPAEVTDQLANLGTVHEIPDPHDVVGLPGRKQVRTAVDIDRRYSRDYTAGPNSGPCRRRPRKTTHKASRRRRHWPDLHGGDVFVFNHTMSRDAVIDMRPAQNQRRNPDAADEADRSTV
jgi:hypothetical protein